MKCRFIFNNEAPKRALEVYLSIEVKYNAEDHQFYNINGGGESVLLINENSFGLTINNETKRISGFSDYLPFIQKLKSRSIPTPENYLDGLLILNSTDELCAGIGYNFKMRKGLHFDKTTKNFLVGKTNPSKPFFRFLKNTYCQLDKKGRLTSIIITDLLDK